MNSKLRSCLLSFFLGAGLIGGVFAEDDKGQFAIKGIGAQSCETFVSQMEIGGDNAYMFGGWIYGYLTGANRFGDDTFDLAPWENLETLSGYLIAYCSNNPQTSFAQAVFNLSSALAANRLQQASDPERLGAGGQQLIVYQEVVRRVQAELKAQNVYSGEVDGIFNEDTMNALKVFQTNKEIPTTGLPDQTTLHHLLRGAQP